MYFLKSISAVTNYNCSSCSEKQSENRSQVIQVIHSKFQAADSLQSAVTNLFLFLILDFVTILCTIIFFKCWANFNFLKMYAYLQKEYGMMMSISQADIQHLKKIFLGKIQKIYKREGCFVATFGVYNTFCSSLIL